MYPVKKQSLVTVLLSLFILAVLAFPVSAAYGTYTGIVYLTDGSKYENIEFKVNKTFKTISFEYEEKKVNVSFTNIDRIYDEENNEITAEVLGEYYKPKDAPPAPKPVVKDTTVTNPEVKKPVVEENQSDWRSRDENWKSADAEVYQKAREKLWDAGVCLNGNFSIPTGSYYDGLTSGIGFGGDFIISLARTFGLRFTVSKSGMKPEENLILFYSLDPQYVITNQEISMDAFRYLLSFQYHILLDKNSSDNSIFYLFTGFGAISEKVTFEIEYRDTGTNVLYSDKADNTESNFVLTTGAGIVKMVSPSIGFDFGLNVDLVFTGAEEYFENSSAALIDFKFGLIAVF